jgi:DNA polymerase-2
MERYSLDHVAREVLGEGKIHAGGDRAAQILHDFKHERERFVEYNRTDARLVTEILERLGLVELAVERSRLTGMPLDRVGASIAAFDFLYLSELHRRQIGAPTVGAPGHEGEPHTGGGHVLEPTPGLYEHVLVVDFQSLYPSIIRTFEIDPLGYLPGRHSFEGDPTDPTSPIVAPNGAAFRRDHGILPRLLDDLVPRREAAKKAGDKVASQAIKILMNSFYGVLGTPACRFHNGAIATAITAFGQELLLWSRDRIESYGHRVLYGDTDSLFFEAGIERGGDAGEALRIGEAVVERLNSDLAAYVQTRWGVESRLQLELEKLFLRLFLPPMRHSSAGARKRYVGLMEQDGEEHVVFTGMEVVRRDWTELARRVQRELYRRLFLDLPVEAYLKTVVREVREGAHDDLLVYLKGLGKDLDDYTASTPPHVVAARKMRRKPGRLIAYVITERGPEPAEERRSPFDYDHYVQKQLRPVAEPVLHLLELEFDKVIGDDRQLELF